MDRQGDPTSHGQRRQPGAARWRRHPQFLGVPPMSSFPSEAYRRRAIVIVDDGRKDALETSLEGQRLLRDRSAVVLEAPITDDLRAAHPALGQLEAHGLLEPGQLLAQHPSYPDRYLPADALGAEVAR